jgi:hypothetical protein
MELPVKELKAFYTTRPQGSDWHQLPHASLAHVKNALHERFAYQTSYKIVSWSDENLIAFAAPEGAYFGDDVQCPSQVIYIQSADDPSTHFKLITSHIAPIFTLEWSPILMNCNVKMLLSADQMGRIQIWKPRSNEFVNEWMSMALFETDPCVLAKWWYPLKKYNTEESGVKWESFSKKFALASDQKAFEDRPLTAVSFLCLSTSGNLRVVTYNPSLNLWSFLDTQLKCLPMQIVQAQFHPHSFTRGMLAVVGTPLTSGNDVCLFDVKIHFNDYRLIVSLNSRIEIPLINRMTETVDTFTHVTQSPFPVSTFSSEWSQKTKKEAMKYIHQVIGVESEVTDCLIGDSFAVHHIAFHPHNPSVLYLVVCDNRQLFLQRWQFQKHSLVIDPAFGPWSKHIANILTEDWKMMTSVSLSDKQNVTQKRHSNYVTAISVNRHNFVVLIFFDGHTELRDCDTLKLLAIFGQTKSNEKTLLNNSASMSERIRLSLTNSIPTIFPSAIIQTQNKHEVNSDMNKETQNDVILSQPMVGPIVDKNASKRKHMDTTNDHRDDSLNDGQPTKRQKIERTEDHKSNQSDENQTVGFTNQTKDSFTYAFNKLKLTSTKNSTNFSSVSNTHWTDLTPISVTFSPNSTCMAILYDNSTLQIVPLIWFCPSETNLSKGQQIANEFELALERGTEWWDVLILLLTYCQLPEYRELYKDVIVYLIDDYRSLSRLQQQHLFVSIEAIKSAIYRHFPKMHINFANSQGRLFLHWITQTIKYVVKDFPYLYKFNEKEEDIESLLANPLLSLSGASTQQQQPQPPPQQQQPQQQQQQQQQQSQQSQQQPQPGLLNAIDRETIHSLFPHLEWCVSFFLAARKAIQSFGRQFNSQEVRSFVEFPLPSIPRTSSPQSATSHSSDHSLRASPRNWEEYFAIAPDPIHELSLSYLFETETWSLVKECLFFCSQLVNQKFSRFLSTLNNVAGNSSLQNTYVSMSQQQQLRKFLQMFNHLYLYMKIARHFRNVITATKLFEREFRSEEALELLDEMCSVLRASSALLTSTSFPQPIRSKTEGTLLASFLFAVTDLIPLRLKVSEIHNMDGAFSWPQWSSGSVVDHQHDHPSPFFHMKDMYHFQKKHLQELIQSGDVFDVVTRYHLPPNNILRQCTRCNRLACLSIKTSTMWYHQWTLACPICGGRWRKIQLESNS